MSWEDWPQEFYEEGFDEEESEDVYEFDTALDESVCADCAQFDGEQLTLDEIDAFFPDSWESGPDVIEVDLHDGCRCELVLIEEDWEEE